MKVINPSFILVENKLKDARFFLNHLEEVPADLDNPSNFFEATCYLSAFASSARSITFVLKKVMKRTSGFDEWYEAITKDLQANSIARSMAKIRNEIQKEGDTRIKGNYEMKNRKGGIDKGWSLEYDDGNDLIDSDASFVCKAYFETLRRIVGACALRFSVEYDPQKLWSIEGLRELGTTIREVEDLYRLPSFFFKGMSVDEQIDAIRTMENVEPPTLFLMPSDRAKRLGRMDPLLPIDL